MTCGKSFQLLMSLGEQQFEFMVSSTNGNEKNDKNPRAGEAWQPGYVS
jgi:hypothetical protein